MHLNGSSILLLLTLLTSINGVANSFETKATPSVSSSRANSPTPTQHPVPVANPTAASNAGSTPLDTKVWIAYLLRQKRTGKIIPNLNFKNKTVPVSLIPKNGILQPMIAIEGFFDKHGWELNFGTETLLVPKEGSREFTLHFFITDRLNEFVLTAKGPGGEVIQEKVFIYAPQANEYLHVSPWNALMLSAGIAGMGYYQSNYGIYESLMTNLSLRYMPLEGESPWNWAAQLDMTLQTLWSKPLKSSPQLIEGKLIGSYRLDSHFDVRLTEQILFGSNYLTMLANDSPFGFSNLVAPELGWRLLWKEDRVNSFVGDVRF